MAATDHRYQHVARLRSLAGSPCLSPPLHELRQA